jgi:hypothetical protein
MQFIRFSLFFLFNGLAHGQVISKDHKMGYVLVDNDEVVMTRFNWKKYCIKRKVDLDAETISDLQTESI